MIINALWLRGYTAPEYAVHGQLSEKVDTYSYGIVVLEIISGQKSSDMLVHPGAEFLLKRVSPLQVHKSWRASRTRVQMYVIS